MISKKLFFFQTRKLSKDCGFRWKLHYQLLWSIAWTGGCMMSWFSLQECLVLQIKQHRLWWWIWWVWYISLALGLVFLQSLLSETWLGKAMLKKQKWRIESFREMQFSSFQCLQSSFTYLKNLYLDSWQTKQMSLMLQIRSYSCLQSIYSQST